MLLQYIICWSHAIQNLFFPQQGFKQKYAIFYTTIISRELSLYFFVSRSLQQKVIMQAYKTKIILVFIHAGKAMESVPQLYF